MKPNVIKTRFICADTLGHAQHLLASMRLSILLPLDQQRQMFAGIVVKNSPTQQIGKRAQSI
jgi:hypothetical protein